MRHFRELTRRSFLRGTSGAILSLPWLEGMRLHAAESTSPPTRMGFFYVPIGVVRKGFFPGEKDAALLNFKGNLDVKNGGDFLPAGKYPLELTPTLKPLENIKHKVTLVTGVDRTFQIGTDVHAQCASCFLSSAAPFTIKTSAWPLERTLDHLVADQIGQETPFRTIELSCNSHKDNLESIYFDNISWYGTGHVAPSIRDPRKLYRRLFGTEEIQSSRNITDLVLDDARSLRRELGRSDRDKLSEYFESVRNIEDRLDKLENMKSELSQVPFEEPTESYLPRGEYLRLMGDLMVVAFQTGLTRVASMMVAPERWNTPFTYEGVFDKPVSHHQMSHDQKEYVEQLLKLDHFHMQQFAYIVEKMESIQESDGSTLLDNTILTFGSGLGDGATHQFDDLPIIVAGSGGGRLNTGMHLNCADGTPLANLWLTQANAMGLNLQRFAESTGEISQLVLS